LNVDALIIGAGINGLLTALFLARHGLRLGLVDQGAIAREASWAGAGILSPLLPWDYDEEVNALAERGRFLWPRLAESLKQATHIDPEYWACGMLAMGDFDVDTATAWCKDHDWTCSQAPAQGKIDPAKAASALWLPQVAQARNPRLVRSLEAACRQAGVTFMEHLGITGFDHAQGEIRAALTVDGEIRARHYVVTSGAWSGALLGEQALDLDITPVRGQIILFKTDPGVLGHILYRDGKYLVPRRDGHILVGSTLENVGFEKACTPEAKEALLNFAVDTLPPLQHTELVNHWSGLRPGSPGNLPTIARHPALENLYINSGHFRYGVTMAPASAELLTELLLDRPTTLDALPYAWPHT
jgi:glycine oxidase